MIENPQSYLHLIDNDLVQAGLQYAFTGGIALAAYGHYRDVSDIDVLVSKKSAGNIDVLLDFGYYKQPNKRKPGKLILLNDGLEILIDIIVQGDSLNNHVKPDPTRVRQRIDALWYIKLPTLVEFKLGLGRPKDIEDVEYLIGLHTFGPRFISSLKEPFRQPFLEIFRSLQHEKNT